MAYNGMTLFLSLLLSLPCLASPLSDLPLFATQVPWAEVDKEVVGYIQNETNESVAEMKSHYTLALFEDAPSQTSWYILDGYYQLKSGKILFLDFTYHPENKTWEAINNYEFYLPGLTGRRMLEADEICNPFKRHFIGILRAGAAQLPGFQDFFAKNFQRQPVFLLDDDLMLIADPTKSARANHDVMFTLNETSLRQEFTSLNLNANLIPSGRAPSSAERKQTYVGSTASCLR